MQVCTHQLVIFRFEFRASEAPSYLVHNMPKHLLDMFQSEIKLTVSPVSNVARSNDDTLPDLTRVAGGVRTWSLANGRECVYTFA